jgi:hypothetical protein
MNTPPSPAHTTDRLWAAGALHRARRQHPEITSYGFGVPPGMADAWCGGLDPDDLEQIAACGMFLAGLPQVTPGRRCPGSYALKHRIERWAGRYIREGALIAAAVALGVPLRRHGLHHHGVVLGLAAAPTADRLASRLHTLLNRKP